MISFSIYDYILIILYFAGVIYIGFRTKIEDKSNIDYLVAGRAITLPAFVATLVSTFYGGILGIGEFTYRYGISSWVMNAFPYYFFITIFAFFLAKKIRKAELFTIADKLDQAYGKKVSVFGASLVFLLVTPAPYILMLGILVQVIFGLSLNASMLICLLISVIFLFKGGLKADVRVNIFEFILMFLGFGIILPFCYFKLGGIDYLSANLPESHTSLTGGTSTGYLFVWFFIGMWALVDPGFHQRCYAAKDGATAKKGVLISLIFWFIFDFMTTISGLYAYVHLKNLENPAMSYPLLANDILPAVAKGFFFVGMIATIMSTFHSLLFISAATLGKDIICRIRNIADEKNIYTKIGIAVTSVLSILIAILIPSVVQIWYTIGSLTIPSLLIGVISSYSDKLTINKTIIFSAMIVSFLFSFTSFIFGNIYSAGGIPVYFLNLEPMYPGLFAGILIYLSGLIFNKREKIY
ncbi:MAG: sodium:solute symporter family protein [Ignavibacteriae bacterium]|nr:sodium:solute symporter family protein [Ignavibacteriota bacterium]